MRGNDKKTTPTPPTTTRRKEGGRLRGSFWLRKPSIGVSETGSPLRFVSGATFWASEDDYSQTVTLFNGKMASELKHFRLMILMTDAAEADRNLDFKIMKKKSDNSELCNLSSTLYHPLCGFVVRYFTVEKISGRGKIDC